MLNGLLLSDIHSGSVYAPAVPKAKTDYSGGTIGLNPFQRNVLLPKWKEMCSRGPFDFVVVNGDLVDGLNTRSKGTGIWTYLLDLQADNCVSLLDMISVKPDAPIIIIGGTPYHVGENPGIDQSVAEKLAALGKNAEYKGLEHILAYGKQKFHFSHYAGDAIYEGTPLSREIMFSYKYDIDVTGMFRGHRHHFWLDSDGFRFCAMLPCWKGRDDYVKGKGMRYARTQIGWVEFHIDKDSWSIDSKHLWNLKNQIDITRLKGKTETFI